jgi:hypothetical protein
MVHVPVPLPQPAWIAVYHWLILVPVLSLTHKQYESEPETAFHVYAGVLVPMVPEGDIWVAGPGTAS